MTEKRFDTGAFLNLGAVFSEEKNLNPNCCKKESKHLEKQKVKVELVRSCYLTRYPCHVCGGLTGKDSILAEVKEGEFKGFRVCRQCIAQRDFDRKLLKRAEHLTEVVTTLRSLVGRLEVPTLQEYEARTRDYEVLLEFYYSEPWERVRKMQLAEHPICQSCSSERATTVDPIKPVKDKDGRLDVSKLQSLCNSCYKKKYPRGKE
jgi:hypothetical protein